MAWPKVDSLYALWAMQELYANIISTINKDWCFVVVFATVKRYRLYDTSMDIFWILTHAFNYQIHLKLS